MVKHDDKDKAEAKEEASKPRRIKYMGSSDIRSFSANDNFGNRLQGGLGVDLEWNNQTGENPISVSLDQDALDLVMAEQERAGNGGFIPAFQDVTGMRKLPDSEWQKRWQPQGLPDARLGGSVVADHNPPVGGQEVGGESASQGNFSTP